MNRVMIVGGPGSGKSTLARWIGAQTGLPVQHMDQIHWRPNWVERSMAEKVALIAAVEARDRWVIEGAVAPRYQARLARADMVIWLDLPIYLRLWRVARRSFTWRGQVRPDLAEGCPEQFNLQTPRLLVWVWRRRTLQRQKVADAIGRYQGAAAVVHLTNRRAVAEFMQGFGQRTGYVDE